MNTTKQQVEKTLNSIENIQGAEASPFLYQKVMQRLNSGSVRVISIKPALIWSAAACFVLLLWLNVFTCINYTKTLSYSTNTIKTTTENPLVKDYFLTSNLPQF